MSKFVKLWTAAPVNGRLRNPDEGVLHLEDGEANRLIEAAVGEDVTDDFSAEQRKNTPVESVTTVQPSPASVPPPFDPGRENARIIAERRTAAAEPTKPSSKSK